MKKRVGPIGLRTRIVGRGDAALSTLRVNANYGHGVELYRNFALWPIRVSVSTDLDADNQLKFDRDDPARWGFTVELYPNRGAAEQTRLMKCCARTSGRAQVVVNIKTNANLSDWVAISLKIEDPPK